MAEKTSREKSWIESEISRRTFLKASAALGVAIGVARVIKPASASASSGPQPSTLSIPGPDPVEGTTGVIIKRTTCLMCHSGCGIQVKIKDGVVIKVDGNPYDPRTLEPHLPFATDPEEADRIRGTVCAKGQAAIEELYSPYRVKQPLKRAGPRGSGRWRAIGWDQALTEVIEGGDLFGEGHVDGLRAIGDLETLIDPNAPELGPKANQLVYSVGRSEHGRKELTDRFFGDAFGTKNKRIDHTSICETSHHVAYELLLNAGGIGGKGKNHLKPDIIDAEYIIWFGSSPYEANFTFIALAR
ncbi:MAG: twin-arginine translocation signal domain-containing protein, partial [Dehalococcoidia bacterium]